MILTVWAAPAVSLAAAPLESLPFHAGDQLDDRELAQTRGQGLERRPLLSNQGGRIVIWDEWARSGTAGNGGAVSPAGLGFINYGQQQATFTAAR
jgi:hypothetical protein